MRQPDCWVRGCRLLLVWRPPKRRNDPHRVFAIVGDGEMHEGQIWETLQQAGHMKMDNLVAIIDYNGFSSTIRSMKSLTSSRWRTKSAALAGMYWNCTTAMICIRLPIP